MTNSYLDFDLEIGKGKDGIYAIQARWQGNEAWQEAQLANHTDRLPCAKRSKRRSTIRPCAVANGAVPTTKLLSRA